VPQWVQLPRMASTASGVRDLRPSIHGQSANESIDVLAAVPSTRLHIERRPDERRTVTMSVFLLDDFLDPRATALVLQRLRQGETPTASSN